MEDTNNTQARKIARKAGRTINKYRYELTLIGIGSVLGYSVSKRRFTSELRSNVADANAWLEREFAKVNGNFQIGDPADGGYIIPIIKSI